MSTAADRDWGLELPDESALALIRPEAGRVPTVANWIEEYKLSYFPKIAPGTQAYNAVYLKRFALWMGTRRITKDLVVQYCNEQRQLKVRPATLQHSYTTLKQFLTWCERVGYIRDKIAFLVPRVTIVLPDPKRFTPEQYMTLKETTRGTVWYYASVLAYRTGMRLSDVHLLTWENVDLERLVITYTPFKTRRKGIRAVCPIESGSDLHEVLIDMDKTKRSRHPLWAPYVCPEMAMYYPKHGGQSALVRGGFHPFKRFCLKIGAGHLSFHKLRNSFMSRLVEADINWAKACQITGLKTFSVFLRYAKPNPEILRQDMAALSRIEAEQLAKSGMVIPDRTPQKQLGNGEP